MNEGCSEGRFMVPVKRQKERLPMSPVIEERLRKIAGLSLKSGPHSPDSTFCVMEAEAFIHGKQWGDHDRDACPIISAFLRSWNDLLPTDGDRDRLLKPFLGHIIGTKSTKAIETKRTLMAGDWMIRVHTPAWLRLAGLITQADLLEALPEITDMAQSPSLREPLEAVRCGSSAARDAAWDAAWDKLAPTVAELQMSALALVERMIEAK